MNVLVAVADEYLKVTPSSRVMGPLTIHESHFLDRTYWGHAEWMRTDPGSCTPLADELADFRYWVARVRAGLDCSCLLEIIDCQPCLDGGAGMSRY